MRAGARAFSGPSSISLAPEASVSSPPHCFTDTYPNDLMIAICTVRCAAKRENATRHPPISVSFIDRACGETFLHMLRHFSPYAFLPRVRYKMQRLPYPPHMSPGILCAGCAVPHRSRHAPSMPCRSSVSQRSTPHGMASRRTTAMASLTVESRITPSIP